MGGKHDKKERVLNWEDPFPRVSKYKTGSDIKEGDTTKIRVYLMQESSCSHNKL